MLGAPRPHVSTELATRIYLTLEAIQERAPCRGSVRSRVTDTRVQ
jgi:hypothetical protein